MLRNAVWFALGVITTTIVFLRWDPLTKSDSTFGTDDGATAVRISSENRTIVRAEELAAPRAESSRQSTTEPSEQLRESRVDSDAAEANRVPEELRQAADESFAFLSDNKDRHDIFSNEERDRGPVSMGLESAILNRVWQVVGNDFPPVSVEAECRSSGCRVVLIYPTLQDAAAADMSGILSSQLFPDLELHGFGAMETRLGHDGEGQAKSVLQGPNINVFLWRRSDSDPQAIPGGASRDRIE